MLDSDSPFWKFSLAVYAAPGVAPECLALQEQLHIDVNALLFCAWLGRANSITLTETHLAAIDRRVRDWHDTVVRPIRAVRQNIKAMPERDHDAVDELRKTIAGVELQAERIEQALLFETAGALCVGAATPARAEDAVRANVMAFLARKSIETKAVVTAVPPPERLIAAAIAQSV